jgi:hypothetical protein
MAGKSTKTIKKVGDLTQSIGFIDRAFTSDRLQILTRESLSENQELTPEGFLLCKNVPIARTGEQLYTADEIGLEGRGGDGLVKIQRTEDHVFHPDTVASFEGKPVTIDHPDGIEVNPDNWRELTVGIVQNVRRGDGIEDDLLLADLLITDAKGIDLVLNKKLKEVSCGYDADYVQIDAGLGRQENIIGNHVALVERGRAGARCSIRDKETITMKTKKLGFLDKLRKFLDAEAAELEKEEQKTGDADGDDDESQKTGDEDQTGARLDALENGTAEIMKQLSAITAMLSAKTGDSDDEEDDGKTGDEDMPNGEEDDKTGDADLTEAETASKNADASGQKFGDSMRDVLARAEILAPGIKVPSQDAMKAKGAAEGVMRKALGVAIENADYGATIKPLLFGRSLAQLTGDSLKVAFVGASEMVKNHNNTKGVRSSVGTKDFGRAITPAQINARNREVWKQ